MEQERHRRVGEAAHVDWCAQVGCEDWRQIDIEMGRCVVGHPDADIEIVEVILPVA